MPKHAVLCFISFAVVFAGCVNRSETKPSGLILEVSPTVVPADGVSSATLTLNLGTTELTAGAQVSFSSSNPRAQIIQPAPGSVQLTAVGSIRCAEPGMQQVSAYVVRGDATVALPVAATVYFGNAGGATSGTGVGGGGTAGTGGSASTTGGAPGAGVPSGGTSTLIASPTTVVADGVSTTALTVSVLDAYGAPVTGQAVTITSSGSTNVFSPASGEALTDASGNATVQMASTTAEDKTIMATVGSVSLRATALFKPAAASGTTSTLVAQPNTVTADGSSATSLTITVLDAHGNPVTGQAVTFSSSGAGNSISSTMGTTGSDGKLTTTMTSTVAQTKTITAQFAGQSVTTQVTFVTGSASSATTSLVATPSSVAADGVTPSALVLTVHDAQGNPIAGQTVSLLASGTGYAITPTSGPTSASGVFNANIVSTKAEVKAVTATAGTATASAAITFTAGLPNSVVSSLAASPNIVSADGTSTSTLTTTVRDAYGNPLNSVSVAYSASPPTGDAWTPASSGTTDANGVFVARLSTTNAGLQVASANVSSGLFTLNANVQFNTPLVSTTNSTFTASPNSLIANGTALCTLTVTLRNSSNAALSGQTVTFSSSGSANTFTPQSAVTDASGVVTATLASTKAEPKALTALVDGTSLTAAVTFTAGTAAAGTSTLTASPSSVKADGTSNSNIVVTVTDAQSNPVSGQAVSFSYGGASYTFTTVTGTTNASGVLTSTLVSTLTQTQNVTASVGGSFTLQAPLTFTAGAPSSPNSTLVAAPPSVIADGNALTALTMTVKDAHGNAVGSQAVTLGSTGTNYTFVPPSGNTNASGVFNANMVSTKAEVKTVTATAGMASRTASVTFVAGAPSTLQSSVVASPNTVVAATNTTLTVTVEDSQGNPVSARAINLSSSGTANTFGNPNGTTDSNGQYSTPFMSTKAETKTVNANTGNGNVTANVVVTAGNPNVAHSSLTATPSGLPADNATNSALSLSMADAYGNPCANVTVTFSASDSNAVFSSATGALNTSGTLTGVTVHSPHAGVNTLSASNSGTSVSAVVTFVAGSPNNTRSSLTVNPTSVSANGSSTATLTVRSADTFGNGLSGQGATFTVGGTGNTFSPSTLSGVTDANGNFSVAMSSTLAQVKSVNAVVSSTFSFSSAVTFTATGTPLCTGTPGYPGPPGVTAAAIVVSSALVDLNGDSNNDILAVTQGNTIVTAIGLGNGTFANPNIITGLTLTPTAFAAADFNKDGKVDLVVGQAGSTSLSIWAGKGDGTFATHGTFAVCNNPVGIAAADLSGDGNQDLAITCSNSNVASYLGNGNFVFTQKSLLSVANTPSALALGTFDTGSTIDVAVASQSGNTTYFWTNDGTGTLTLKGSGPNGGTCMAAADVTGDGLTDVVLGNSNGVNVRVLKSTGTALSAAGSYNVSNYLGYIFLTDINQDGKLDIVGSETQQDFGAGIDILLGAGNGNFAAPIHNNLGKVSHGTTVGKINSDAYPDILNSDTGFVLFPVLNTGNGNLLLPNAIDLNFDYSPSVTAADYDKDGDLDLAMIDDSNMLILTNKGNGTFNAPTLIAGFGGGGWADWAMDVNSDGNQDVVVVGNGMVAFYGKGNGTFNPGVTFSSNCGSTGLIAVGKINADAYNDIAIYASSTITVKTGGAGSVFTTIATFATSGDPTGAIDLQDYNGDGHVDLLWQASGTINMRPGNGTGTFGTAVTTTGTTQGWLSMGDWDGDGDIDLFISHNSKISNVWLNAGNGSFTAGSTYTYTVARGNNITFVSDMNGDSHLDIIFGGYTPEADIGIAYGDGAGHFGAPAYYNASVGVQYCAIGDFNLDGQVDIAGAAFWGAAVDVLLYNTCYH